MHTAHNILVPTAVLLNKKCSYKSKLVYCILAAKAKKSKTVTISLHEIARMGNICINTVRDALTGLIALGHIARISAPNEQGVYRLLSQDSKCTRVPLPINIVLNITYTAVQKVVYAVLVAYRTIGRDNGCYPSYRTLADVANLCVRSIQYAVHTLRLRNVIATQLICRPTYYPYMAYSFLRDYDVADTDLALPSTDSIYHTYAMADAIARDKEKTCDEIATLDTGAKKKVLTQNTYSDDSNYISSDQNCQAQEITVSSLREQLHYDWLIQSTAQSNVDLCIRCLLDYLSKCRHKSIVLRGRKYDYATMRDSITALTQYHMLYAISQYRAAARTRKIRYATSYLVSVILGSLTDCDASALAALEHDFPVF